MWFDPEPTKMHSLAEWVVYMLECQIKQAFYEHKASPKGKCQYCPTPEITNLYKYARQFYASDDKIKQIVQKAIGQVFKSQKGKENYINKKNFYLVKCMDRIKEQKDPAEYLIQYNWYEDNKQNENFIIFEKLAENLDDQFQKWKEDKLLEQWNQERDRSKEKKMNKKLKKKEKKNKDKQQADEQIAQSTENVATNNKQQKPKEEQKDSKNSSKIEAKTKTDKQIQPAVKKQQPAATIKKQLGKKQSKVQQPPAAKKQQQPATMIIKNQPTVNTTKIIRQRISQYYDAYTQQLVQAAAVYQKYWKTVYNVVYRFVKDQLIEQLQAKDQVVDWKLEIYGSSCAGFALKHSDIDMVLLVTEGKTTLHNIFNKLKLQGWAINCKFIQAAVPIITMQVSLKFSQVAVQELSQKQMKKLEGELFSVDFTLAPLNKVHSGIENTKQLREIYEKFPVIRSICLIIKEFLRSRGLNKPFTGGINSYILIMMTHAILSKKNLLAAKAGQQNTDQYRQIREMSLFLQKEFKPFETVISWKKQSEVKADKTLHLNIVNPHTGQLLKTSAFQIEQIVVEMRKFREFQERLEDQLHYIGINQKKNMRNHFMKAFQEFMALK